MIKFQSHMGYSTGLCHHHDCYPSLDCTFHQPEEVQRGNAERLMANWFDLDSLMYFIQLINQYGKNLGQVLESLHHTCKIYDSQ